MRFSPGGLPARVANLKPAIQPDCVTCSRASEEPTNAARWTKYKCCTFQPFVANFVAGAMIDNGLDPFKIDSAKAHARALGVSATARFRENHLKLEEAQHGEAQLCTYFDPEQRRCGVWRFRPAECSLYYCTHDARKPTREAWSQTAFQIETAVAQMALAHLGFTANEIAREIEELNAPNPASRSASATHLRDHYRAAWAFARPLTAAQVREWWDDNLTQDG